MYLPDLAPGSNNWGGATAVARKKLLRLSFPSENSTKKGLYLVEIGVLPKFSKDPLNDPINRIVQQHKQKISNHKLKNLCYMLPRSDVVLLFPPQNFTVGDVLVSGNYCFVFDS